MVIVTDFIFLAPKSLQMVTAAIKLKDACSLGKNYDQPKQQIKKERHHFADKVIKVHIVKALVFPVVMYECVSWTIKKSECLRTDAYQLWCWRRFESPLDRKEIKLVNPEGNRS